MTGQDSPTHQPATAMQSIFIGPNGIRAGWRLIAGFVIFFVFVIALDAIIPSLLRIFGLHIGDAVSPAAILTGEMLTLAAYLLAAWIMSCIEGRRFRDYGFGARGAFGILFWLSAIAGFAALSVLLGSLRLLGAYHLGPLALHGREAVKYAAFWGATFFVVGVLEENLFRGYLLFTLTTGMTFWPAAMLCSIIFGSTHLLNGGESRVGVLSVAAVGVLLCILIRKTGNLWPAIGFHFAWDWGESYFYGTPDSGIVTPGHLFSAQFSGPLWLTGGSAGPEASWLCLLMLLLLSALGAMIPGAQYPHPGAIPDPRRRPAESPTALFPKPTEETQS